MAEGIAIIGMAGKFPGVENIYEYWEKIKKGEDMLTRFSDEELRDKGVDQGILQDKYFVPANGLISSAEFFDSGFFGFTPREADLTDPQHRKFLEVCYEALEHAGQSPDQYSGSIGVFAGCSMNNYLLKNLLQYPELLKSIGEFQSIVNNDKDFLTTKVSYKLNLTGPSFDIQTACSTSLVAVHVACQNLLNYQCDIALGGGAFIMNPRGEGYMFKPGGIESPDGVCRPFDSEANGTVFGEGVGAVVLKRLDDAIADRDEIWAVIRSSAINNDGSVKVGYMAPSISGQAGAIDMAQAFGEIDPSTITYIETHGTGTSLGDPIEITALTNVFRKYTDAKNYCAIGSVKGNIGHCDVAAGVAGLIKTAMTLKFKMIPPSIHYKSPNPELRLNESPFYVNTQLREWKTEGIPRRAAISSFGIGGTNAHCILEEWDTPVSEESNREMHLLPLSAKSDSALNRMAENLSGFLQKSLHKTADIAHTLQQGRNVYDFRAVCYGADNRELAREIGSGNHLIKGKRTLDDPGIVFMFTGQGSQYINMARGLYKHFSLFRNIVDEAASILRNEFELDLPGLLFGDFDDKEARTRINLTANTQPLLYVVQYATACLLADFGIFPDAMIGHSIGELTAAAYSGVFSFEDGLRIVASRGRIMQAQQPGSMLSVSMPAGDLQKLLPQEIELSLQNAPGYSVVSGTDEDIRLFEENLKKDHPHLHTTILKTSHAFHSRLMEPALEPFRQVFKDIVPGNPEVPFISNVTGTWVNADECTSPDYWADHIRSTVRFSDGVGDLLRSSDSLIFVEVGPGNSLSMLLSQFDGMRKSKAISTIRHPMTEADDVQVFMKSVADFWIHGGEIRWEEMYAEEKRNKVPLPTYPFERKRHWLEPRSRGTYQSGDVSEDFASVSLPDEEDFSGNTEAMHDRPDLPGEFVAPESDLEKKVVGIWEKLLGIKGIGVEDDFFALGGHSLLASQVINRISDTFSVKLPLEGIFQAPSVRELTRKFDFRTGDHEVPEELEHTEATGRLPLSFDQKRLWIINKIDQNNPAYNIPFTYRLTGNLDTGIFEKSIRLLLDRHQVLDTHLQVIDGEPYSQLNTRKENLISFPDLREMNEEEQKNKVQELFGEDTRKGFDLEKGPLYRIFLARIGENDYLFHMTVQHMVFDGWSWGVFVKELNEIYNQLLNGKEIRLPKADHQYFDYARWQSEQTGDDQHKEAIAYWKKALEGYPVELKFPYDRPRPALPSGFGGRETIRLEKQLSEQLNSLSRQNGCTLFMTMMASLSVLLNRYSGETDICIGTPTANRTKSAFENLIGFFVNTIVIRQHIDRSESFNELLGRTRRVALDALEHQDLPFEKLVDILQPERLLNVNPVYQVLFAWQNTPRPPLAFEGVNAERVELYNGVSPLDITFYMWEDQGTIEGVIEFNTDILDRETIQLLRSNYIAILSDIANAPDKPVERLQYRSEDEQKLLSEYNSSTQKPLDLEYVHQLIQAAVRNKGNKTAVISKGRELTYAQLDAESSKFSNYLISKRTQAGDIVGVSLERSVDMLVAVLGILKAGAAYLPMDPMFPDERLAYMLEDSGAGLLVTETRLMSRYRKVRSEIINLDKERRKIGKQAREVRNQAITPDDLAYMIYTSGSTGKPKGVKVHHRAVVNFINSMKHTPGMSENDCLLAVTTLSFDISVLELFLPLYCGAKVVIAGNDETTDGASLIDSINKHNITLLQATPATWNLLIGSGWQGKSDLKALCGGEAITRNLVKGLLPLVSELWNMYGPTETTVWSTCFRLIDPEAKVLVGKPIDNTTIYILDNSGDIQPTGVTGEVCIGGVGVTKGYHNREELTQEKFIDGPEGEQIYRTGDLGRILHNGDIELFGRIDNQIKLRGFRIEPGEIENLLMKQKGVREAVVKVEKLDELDERLIGYLLADEGTAIEKEQVKRDLGAKIPAYMIPSDLVIMQEFPRTPNGKTDKKALKYDVDDEAGISVAKVEPGNETEKKLHELWSKELKSKQIGVDENFFTIGGHSLLAINLVNKVEKEFDIQYNLRNFFDDPTIKGMSELIQLQHIKLKKPVQHLKVEKQKNVKIVKGEI